MGCIRKPSMLTKQSIPVVTSDQGTRTKGSRFETKEKDIAHQKQIRVIYCIHRQQPLQVRFAHHVRALSRRIGVDAIDSLPHLPPE